MFLASGLFYIFFDIVHIILQRRVNNLNAKVTAQLRSSTDIFSIRVQYIEGNFGGGKLWRGKTLAGENFGEFGDSLQIRQSLTRQLLVAPEISIFIAKN